MARRKKNSDGGVIVVLAIVGAVLASVPKEVWIGVGAIAIFALVVYLANKFSPEKSTAVKPLERQGQTKPRVVRMTGADEDLPVSVGLRSDATEPNNYRIPARPNGVGAAKWLQPGESVAVAGANLTGGMLYVGTTLSTQYGDNDPSLVDPNKSVAARGDYTEPAGGYWPSYSTISKEARRAYLNWLVEGRSHPEADIGYVFLYFYGLERRVIVDAAQDESAAKDLPAIACELRRLIGIYGEKSASFKRYATELLNWIEVSSFNPKLYLDPIPSFEKTWEIPLYVRLALGRCAVDGVPVSAQLALAWVKSNPAISLRTAATRCEAEFDKLFLLKYAEELGQGLILPLNKTKLKFVYRPASSGLRGYSEIKMNFGETPDVTVLTGPVKKLQALVDKVTNELSSFSRFLAKNPDQRESLEGFLQLPPVLWPNKAQAALDGLVARMQDGFLVLSLKDLLNEFNTQAALSKDKMMGLARAFETLNIGMEPDVLNGAKAPKPEDTVVLFSHRGIEPLTRNAAAYQSALLTLQLSAALAAADGEFSAQEMTHLSSQIQSWSHLTTGHIERLSAHLRLLKHTPVSLPSLKKKLETLDLSVREAIASFMVTVAQSDGMVCADEVRMLEKIYKVLGVEPKKVFSDVHAAATGSTKAITPVTDTKADTGGFKLDPARIAELQKDTERVSALLSNIFKEDEMPSTSPNTPEAAPVDEEELSSEPGFLGLDETHSSLARLLLSRPEWSREELLDVAADLDLMLDGALEHINEASFDTYDAPLTEGDDPVTVNTEILEKIEA